MGVVARFDPEGDDLIRRAEAAGGAENLSEGERWRLQNTLDRRRRLEAQAAQPSGRSDALDAQANERRFADIQSRLEHAEMMIRDGLPQVVGECLAEAEERVVIESKKGDDALEQKLDAKLEAQYAGFERAVTQLRDEDRTVLLETVRETMAAAEKRIDAGIANAFEAEKERSECELACVRDELLQTISERQYGRLADDDAAKHVMAEKAIASLRKRMTSVEEEGARQASMNNQLAGVANQLAALEDAHHKARKGLIVRAATTAVLLKKETARADELAGKVERLEAALQQLTDELFRQKVIK
jgi:hypothetical protein